MPQSLPPSLIVPSVRGAWLWGAALLTLLVAVLPAPAGAQTFRICHKPSASGGTMMVVNAAGLQTIWRMATTQ